jgi:UDP-glucuronate 4-epimerase
LKFLLTGAAGFIGSHVADALLAEGHDVVGIDNLDPYYDVARKEANLAEVEGADHPGTFEFRRSDIRDGDAVSALYAEHSFDSVVHLAAMAGVRNSIDHPDVYWSVNLDGTRNLLERLVASDQPNNFVFASTSSVYGATQRIPFVESDPCDRPMVPYSASKRAAELMGYSYHNLYDVNFTAVRFFTVYGPRGRPDMMAFKVLDSIYNGTTVPLNNGGDMSRDWTFISDIVSGVVAAALKPNGYQVVNLGRGEPVSLNDFVALIEKQVGKSAHFEDAPIPTGDIKSTHADVSRARELLDYDPQVSVEEGVQRFVDWYRSAVAKDL